MSDDKPSAHYRPDNGSFTISFEEPGSANLLDRLSSSNRFSYFYNSFFNVEKSLIQEHITNVIRNGKILNVGCGHNGTERHLFPKHAYEIIGVDLNEEGLRQLADKQLYDGIIRGNICALPFATCSIDIVYLRLILHHLVYPDNVLDQAVSECFRVLRKGGILALVEPNSWHPIGALMNIAHMLGVDKLVHGTNDDIALSPRMLRRKLSMHSGNISTHAVTYSWRRLPVAVQSLIDRSHSPLKIVSDIMPYFAHTLMIIAVKG